MRALQFKKEDKRFWVPTMMGIGASISFLGISLINALGICTWAGWVDIGFGQAFIWTSVIWYKQAVSK